MAGPVHKRIILCAAIFLVALPGSGSLAQVRSPLDENAFSLALKKGDEERKGNPPNGFSITHFFSEFRRSDDVSDYVAFFKSLGIPAITVDTNGQHFVYFQLSRQQLERRGLFNFRPDDMVVIVFTTASASSNDIPSFNVRLIRKTFP